MRRTLSTLTGYARIVLASRATTMPYPSSHLLSTNSAMRFRSRTQRLTTSPSHPARRSRDSLKLKSTRLSHEKPPRWHWASILTSSKTCACWARLENLSAEPSRSWEPGIAFTLSSASYSIPFPSITSCSCRTSRTTARPSTSTTCSTPT